MSCNWLRNRQADAVVLHAFKQASQEAGIPDHPGGQCPSPDCTCRDLADQVEARAVEIIEEKLGPLPEAAP